MALVRMLCAPLQKFRIKMLFFSVLCFSLQKCTKNLTVLSYNQEFCIGSEDKNYPIQKDEMR